MSLPFCTTRRVEFSDTDAAGIMHFSAFFRFMEQAEHDLLRSQGLSVVMQDEVAKSGGGKLSWPRVHAHCDFRIPAHYEDVVEIEVSISRLGEKSASYQFRFALAGRELAVGEITSVCCRMIAGQPPQSVAIPDWFRAKLLPFVVSAADG
ncbi:1,4-dihydroxy-2-naphthoyl-CoA hydrolase [Anatilimnocola aggregata]|uniref:1,4-dihydroxy-2-naphthoyl-CoA hydrolase n=1 Tax=Anatilimnocola aggregata TaxID=2528021 RepID=A0A517YHD5_9BACT|nr:thioesterase family protein [Anatilimnocola aggregata]QDU29631.1 1,4-dihydroxy-2-naphthoyl-CoA hydrolase [Anatilimnocola aggregata]